MFLVASPPPHANACTGHNFVTNTPIKFIFAIAIEVPDYKDLMIFGINRKNNMASGGNLASGYIVCILVLEVIGHAPSDWLHTYFCSSGIAADGY